MIDVFEKVLWSLSALLILVIAGVYFYFGAPSPVPSIAVTARKVNAAELRKSMSKETQRQFEEEISTVPGDDGASKAKARSIKQEYVQIPQATFERVSNLADAVHEAKRISSEVVDNTDGTNSLKVFDFDETSTLGRIGFEENDVIDYVGGQKIDFSSMNQAKDLFHRMRDELQQNRYLIVDIKRRNRPMKIVVSLP